jgi:hypothetical protein
VEDGIGEKNWPVLVPRIGRRHKRQLNFKSKAVRF